MVNFMSDKEYQVFVDNNTPRVKKIYNELVAFIGGGLMGVISEVMLEVYSYFLHLPRKDAGVLVILTLIVIASILTAMGIFDVFVVKLKCALIIPITGFAHSITSACIEYKSDGFILGIGANIFRLAGCVILYGVVSVYFFGIIRLLILGG